MKYSVLLKLYLFVLKIWAAEAQDNDYNVQEFSTYKCHCGGQCPREDGRCPADAQCDKGWFGLRCQYQDLLNILNAKITTQPKRLNIEWLPDGNDKTCNDNTNFKSITIKWLDQISIPLTFLRIVVSDPASLSTLEFRLVEEGDTDITPCHRPVYTLKGNNTMDIRCKDNIIITSLVLFGNLSFLCSVYISGGRNVAYRQSAMQTSNYTSLYEAAFAVDGNTDSNLEHNSCSHTNEETSPKWNLTLQSNYVINRIILFNRDNFNFVRLQGFVIQTFDSNRNVIEVYNDKNLAAQRIYQVNLKGNVDHPVNMISISLEGRDKILTLCEVETYGECPSGFWSLPCNKRCPTSCPDDCDRDTGACNNVCIGRSNPPQCDADCIDGRWGIHCRNDCSNECTENICHVRKGLCDQECDCYNNPPYCKTDVYKFSLEFVSFGIGCAACGVLCILVILALALSKTIVCQCKQRSRLEPELLFGKERNHYNEHKETSDDHFYEPVLSCRNNIGANPTVAIRKDTTEYAEA
ncbi:platelet endothelial aggregation receptor 1 [Biomphalaria pfeifferi]|uniref:Platelet endothelial aggregation receptor 1 n=1 Tax=Biomphalaria pfeifferi TaxID=112525 RepID=A0AAD8B1F3_BIOPF|nr:platelet endothelial aggregation receptor 1 [Biomphalaria pfeifferi]